jgi:hypothetical protein
LFPSFWRPLVAASHKTLNLLHCKLRKSAGLKTRLYKTLGKSTGLKTGRYKTKKAANVTTYFE